MRTYSEKEIRIFHAEFREMKKYSGRLELFDQLFDIIPFHFPPFDPQLAFLFNEEESAALEMNFKAERNNPLLTEKKFVFDTILNFNIKPANSNSSVYSSFILSRFLQRAPDFKNGLKKINTEIQPIILQLDDANRLVSQIECNLAQDFDKSFRLQSMSVFYKGFYNAFTGRSHQPEKKRKFTELYLYAQGMIYSEYVSFLKAQLQESPDWQPFHGKRMNAKEKMRLFRETGMADFLKSKFAHMGPAIAEKKMIEIFESLTGEQLEKKEAALRSIASFQKT